MSDPELEPEQKPELEPVSEGYLAQLAVLLLFNDVLVVKGLGARLSKFLGLA